MTKVMKKLSCMLLAVAMVMTMMPALAFADDTPSDVAFKVMFNKAWSGEKVDTGNVVTLSWLNEKTKEVEPQVFPFAAKKGNTWEYHVVQGPTYVDVIEEALGCENLDAIKEARLYCSQKFSLSIEDILGTDYTNVFKCVDENGNDVVGPFSSETNKTKTIKTEIIARNTLIPVVATKVANYETYAEAQAALNDGSWEDMAQPTCKAYVGGVDEEQILWTGEEARMNEKNYNGKFTLNFNNDEPMTITLPESPFETSKKLKMSAVTVSKPTGANAVLPFDTDDMSDAEALLAKTATWTSSDETIAKVDGGHITPVKAGTCTVTAKCLYTGYVCTANVTVNKSALAPLAVTNLKATNVKTRKAKLTWTKSAKASGYYIYRSTKKSSGYKKVKTLKKTASSYTSDKLTKKKTYYYKVVAYNSNGKTTAGPVKVIISK